MFGLFEKKEKMLASVNGKVVPITEVPDDTFAQKILGDGYALIPEGNRVVSPCDAKVTGVFETKHALTLETKYGLEIIVHIGLDTVNLNGEGFETFVKENDEIKAGDLLVEFDNKSIQDKGYNTIIPIIIVNMDKVKSINIKEGNCVEKQEIGTINL